MKPYHCYIKETNISYLEKTIDIVKKSINKPTNEEIFTPLNYLEFARFY